MEILKNKTFSNALKQRAVNVYATVKNDNKKICVVRTHSILSSRARVRLHRRKRESLKK